MIIRKYQSAVKCSTTIKYQSETEEQQGEKICTIYNTQNLVNSGYLRMGNNAHLIVLFTVLFFSKSSEYHYCSLNLDMTVSFKNIQWT